MTSLVKTRKIQRALIEKAQAEAKTGTNLEPLLEEFALFLWKGLLILKNPTIIYVIGHVGSKPKLPDLDVDPQNVCFAWESMENYFHTTLSFNAKLTDRQPIASIISACIQILTIQGKKSLKHYFLLGACYYTVIHILV